MSPVQKKFFPAPFDKAEIEESLLAFDAADALETFSLTPVESAPHYLLDKCLETFEDSSLSLSPLITTSPHKLNYI
ncbi:MULTISPECIES: hypothetical protein [Gardnerella]|uniref:Uncharacterized protein n=1 Tax=Gardnerella leopoldii TaxID=2792978 RepID=A0ABX4SE49_9BIFI|nr:hypothetical protein [Gardnerella vaginalis]PKZ18305.1 hypothetical protein CYJ60_03290 [Gardnerella vaginalis]PKZ19456.1 hypothetical protein CYJ59_03295 [Gardnerella vaginalis]